MRHPNTRAIAEYWQSLRDGQDNLEEGRIGARQMAGLLDHVFILHRYDPDHAVFRLAGPGLTDLYQRDLCEQNFVSLWRGADRLHIQALLSSTVLAPGPGVAMVRAETIMGEGLAAELMIAPLAGRDGVTDRFLGLFQPMSGTETLGGRPVIRQHVTAIYPPRAKARRSGVGARINQRPDPARPAAHLQLVADNTRREKGERPGV